MAENLLNLGTIIAVAEESEIGAGNFTSATDESVTASIDTAVALANGGIKEGSVVVTDDPESTTYVEDTDYTIDYVAGTITALDTGSITDTSALLVDYDYAAWADEDVIVCQDDSGLTPATDSIERNNFNGSFVACKALSGNESTSGDLNLELAVNTVGGTEAGQLRGHYVWKSGLGVYIEQAADVTAVAGEISEEADPVSNPTGYDLYRLSNPNEDRTTLAVREYLGGSNAEVIDHLGVVVESTSIDFPAGDLATVGFSVGGIGYNPTADDAVLQSPGCGADGFVVKNATFTVDGTEFPAQNVSMSINNEVTDRQAIDSTGISNRIVVGKSVELSFGFDLDTANIATTSGDAFGKLKNNREAKVLIELENPDGDQIKFYLPVVTYNDVSKNNDGGVLMMDISAMGYNDTAGNALYMASKKA